MKPPDLERLFDAYRREHDTAALAAVFDATAPKMLLVAAHLVGDRVDAEDVVQTTFVEVLEKADQFDSTLPLEPWLLGILANRAKMALRRRQRSRGSDLTLLADAASDRPGPVAAAVSHEAAQRIGAALDGLPSHYRHVLVLNLVHDLGGVQIAQSLGRSPATVRTQLRRGLELLREALPTALALPAAIWVTEGQGLAAVRAQVLSEAARQTMAAGAAATVAAAATTSAARLAAAQVTSCSTIAATSGPLVMKKLLTSLAVAATLALGVWLGTSSASKSGPASPSTLPTAHPKSGSAGRERDTAPLAGPSAAAERRDITRPDAPRAAPPTDVRIFGRCVDDASGRPVTGAQIEMEIASGAASALGTPKAPVPEATVSDHSGRFELLLAVGTASAPSLSIKAVGYVSLHGRLQRAPQTEMDLGDIRLNRGARLAAKVVNTEGQGVAGVIVSIKAESRSLSGTGNRFAVGGRSRVDGTIAFGDQRLLPPGAWPIEVDERWALLRPDRLLVEPESGVAQCSIVVEPRSAEETICGIVVDENGSPMQGAKIEVGGRDRWDAPARACTDAEGRFATFRRKADADLVALHVVDASSSITVETAPIAWGTPDARIELAHTLGLALVVVHAVTGEPIEDFGVASVSSNRPTRGVASKTAEVEHRGVHPGGKILLRGLGRSGHARIVVMPTSADYAMSEIVDVDLDQPTHGPLRVGLQPRRDVELRVRIAGVGFAEGSTAEIVQAKQNEDLTSSSFVLPRDSVLWNLRHDPGDWPVPFRIDTGTTDAEGRLSLRCPTGRSRLGLRITGKGHAPLTLFPLVLPAVGEVLDVEVQAAATLRGSLGPAGYAKLFVREPELATAEELRKTVRIGVRRPGAETIEIPGGIERGFEVAADGSFEFGGIPPGTWEVVGYWERPTAKDMSFSTVLDPPLAVLEVQSGAVHDLALDLSPHLPGRIEGQLTLDGTPAAHALVTLTLRRGAGVQRVEHNIGAVVADATGAFSIAGLTPADYMLGAITVDAAGIEKQRQALSWQRIDAGQTLRHRFDLVGRTAQLRIVDAAGKPVAHRALTVLCDEYCRWWFAETNAQGVVEIEGAPPSVLRIRVHDAGTTPAPVKYWTNFPDVAKRKDGTVLQPVTIPHGSARFEHKLMLR